MTDNPRAEAIDRLCTALAQLDNDCRCAPHVFYGQALHIAAALDGLLPRRVSSEAELDALPFLSIVREIFAPSPVAGCDYGGVWERRTSGWQCIAANVHRDQPTPRLPALVLWTPPAEGVEA